MAWCSSISVGIGKGEGALDHPDLDGVAGKHLDDVEAEGDVGHVEQAEPMEGSTADEGLFRAIDGIKRASRLLGTTGLYLRKDECLTVTADKIDLPSPGCPEIPAENPPAVVPDMPGSLILSPSAKCQMPRLTKRWGFSKNRNPAGQREKNRVYDADKVHAHGA